MNKGRDCSLRGKRVYLGVDSDIFVAYLLPKSPAKLKILINQADFAGN
jgi:hypothetical protein